MTELAQGFPVFPEGDWRKLAGDMAVSHSADGLPIGPIYGADEGETLSGRPPGMPWRVVSRIASTANIANAIESDIAGGVGGIELTFASSPIAMGEGIADAKELPRFLRLGYFRFFACTKILSAISLRALASPCHQCNAAS